MKSATEEFEQKETKGMEAVKKTVIESVVATVIVSLFAWFGLRPAATSTAAVAVPVNITVVGSSAVPSTRARVFSAPWCIPCRAYRAAVMAEMPPVGWTVAESTDAAASSAYIVFDKEENRERLKKYSIEVYPTTVIERDGKVIKTIKGQITPEKLADEINAVAKGKD